MPFEDWEMDILWKNVDNINYIDILLIQCYSGWRPQELCFLETKNVDLDNWTFIGGIKTDAGINRTVPIHSRIRQLVLNKYQEATRLGSEYLFNCVDNTTNGYGSKLTYDKYRARFIKIRDDLKLNANHRTHDGRMPFITMAKKYKVDDYAIKYMVGHAINDVTEKVYTKREVDWLQNEIEKIK